MFIKTNKLFVFNNKNVFILQHSTGQLKREWMNLKMRECENERGIV